MLLGCRGVSRKVPVKSKVKISQNFVVFSEYMNFTVTHIYVGNFLKIVKVFLLWVIAISIMDFRINGKNPALLALRSHSSLGGIVRSINA